VKRYRNHFLDRVTSEKLEDLVNAAI
jgi:hypothetical protein